MSNANSVNKQDAVSMIDTVREQKVTRKIYYRQLSTASFALQGKDKPPNVIDLLFFFHTGME